MLWRKHWQEMRWVTLLGTIAVCAPAWLVLYDLPLTEAVYDHAAPGTNLSDRTYHLAQVPFMRSVSGYLTVALPIVVFFSALLLGIGGPGHERSSGTASFTLALPFTRRRLALSRFTAGLAVLGAFVLGAVGIVAARAASLGSGGDFTLLSALRFACAPIAGGAAVYAFSYLAANVTGNTIRAVATTLALIALLEWGINQFKANESPAAAALRWVDVLRLISGVDLVRAGSIPWPNLVAAVALAGLFLIVTVRWINHHDF